MVLKMEGNITMVIFNGLDWIVTNSPNTTITILAVLGAILLVSALFETATKLLNVIAYIIAICIYFPFCYLKPRLKKIAKDIWRKNV